MYQCMHDRLFSPISFYPGVNSGPELYPINFAMRDPRVAREKENVTTKHRINKG